MEGCANEKISDKIGLITDGIGLYRTILVSIGQYWPLLKILHPNSLSLVLPIVQNYEKCVSRIFTTNRTIIKTLISELIIIIIMGLLLWW